jgi:hypothetical protein
MSLATEIDALAAAIVNDPEASSLRIEGSTSPMMLCVSRFIEWVCMTLPTLCGINRRDRYLRYDRYP